jgi:N-acetylglutamate synthase
MKTEILSLNMKYYEDVLALWNHCDGVGLSETDSPENIRSYLDRNPEMSFVVEVDGKIVGAILGGHDGRRGYIYHLAIDSRWRRQGIARKLVEKCLTALRAAGICKTHIFIFNTNDTGIAFWKAIGWSERSDVSVVSKLL